MARASSSSTAAGTRSAKRCGRTATVTMVVGISRSHAMPRSPNEGEHTMTTLHVFPTSPRGAKVIALVDHLKLDCECRTVDRFRGEQRRPEFAALNPNQRMPVLEEDGFVLWESNAILQYLASKRPELGLWPADARNQADVARWCNREAAHWTPAGGILAFERVVKKLSSPGGPKPTGGATGDGGS